MLAHKLDTRLTVTCSGGTACRRATGGDFVCRAVRGNASKRPICAGCKGPGSRLRVDGGKLTGRCVRTGFRTGIGCRQA